MCGLGFGTLYILIRILGRSEVTLELFVFVLRYIP